jgi:hypothetical protein
MVTLIVLFCIVLVIVKICQISRNTKYRHARGMFNVECPYCLTYIPDRCIVCPQCHCETGFSRETLRDATWRKAKEAGSRR